MRTRHWCGPTPLGHLGRCGGHMHQHSTSGIRRKEKKKDEKVTPHMLTYGAIWVCRLTSLVICINDKSCDIREGNATIRSEIWTTNIRPLGFQDIRDCVTLWGLILRSSRWTIREVYHGYSLTIIALWDSTS